MAGGHAVDLVDEEHFARLQVRQDAGEIAGLLDHRACRGADRHAQLVGDHVGERRLAEARGAVEQHVIERLAALARRGDRHLQVLAHAVLADVVVQAPRPQAGLVLRVVFDARRRDESGIAHADQARREFLQRPPAAEASKRRSAAVLEHLLEHLVDGLTMVAEIRERGHQIVAAARRLSTGIAGSPAADSSAFGSRSRSSIDDPLGGLLADARDAGQPGDVGALDGADQLARLDAREHGQRQLRADAADARSAARRPPARAAWRSRRARADPRARACARAA